MCCSDQGKSKLNIKRLALKSLSVSNEVRTITAVSIDRLEKTKRDPDVDGKDMQVPHEVAVQQWSSNRASTEDGDLSGMGIFSCKTERCRIFVVNFVNVLV